MKEISARDYDVFKNPGAPFEQTPSGSDFYITEGPDGYSWSTNGETMADGFSSLTRATISVREYAKAKEASGVVWFISGTERKYIGEAQSAS